MLTKKRPPPWATSQCLHARAFELFASQPLNSHAFFDLSAGSSLPFSGSWEGALCSPAIVPSSRLHEMGSGERINEAATAEEMFVECSSCCIWVPWSGSQAWERIAHRRLTAIDRHRQGSGSGDAG